MYSMFRGTESFNLTRTVKYVVNPGAPNDIPEMVEVTAYNLVYPANVEECVQACKNLELEILRKVGVDKKKTIVIRGDQNVPYKSVMKVIDIANKNKLKMILAVKGK